MKIYNTLSRQVEDFKPLNPPIVTFYACGPTVYDYAHIGNIRKYIGDDLIKKSLNYLGYKVKHVMNITDVGHLTSDADTGEDKLEKGAKKTGKTVWEVAEYFTDYFFKSTHAVGITDAEIICRATEHIPDMIALIKRLEEKGFTYDAKEAVYFDTSKLKNYNRLSGQKIEEKQTVRDDVVVDSSKKNPADFALWFKRVGKFADHTMHWESPWGDGFPGWHIECSAMSMKYLGETIDIHSGGMDHIAVHHPNEIAQSESATGKQFVKYFIHHAFLNMQGDKISKSKGTFIRIEDIVSQGINPLSLRLLFMQTSYRQPMDFSFESARAANEAYSRLKQFVVSFKSQTERASLSQEKLEKVDEYRRQFREAISDDFNFPKALTVMWEVTKSNIPSTDKLDLLYDFDQVFGLNLQLAHGKKIPKDIVELAEKRKIAKANRDFRAADRIRTEIKDKGYLIEDYSTGYKIKKIKNT